MRLALALLFALTACGDDTSGNAIIGCLDPSSGRYVSCTGDTRCVDPASGVQVQCLAPGGDTPFQSGGDGAGGAVDAVSADAGGSPDAGPAGDTGGAVAPDLGGSPGGTLTCEQVFACFDACAGDAACQKTCTDGGTPAALAGFSLFTSCSNTNGCAAALSSGFTGGYISCVYRFCLGEYQGCFGALIAGTQTCSQMVTCMNGCPEGSAVCLKTCGEAGTLDAQLLYFDILSCGEKACPGKVGQAWADCVNASCTAELTACGK